MKKKIIVTSVATIIVCLALVMGATYALFTDNAEVNIAATSGKVDIEAYVDQTSLEKYSLEVDRTAEDTFTNGGTADFNADGELVLDKVTPGDGVYFDIKIDNDSNVAIQYNVKMIVVYDDTLTQEQVAANEAFANALVAKAKIGTTEYVINGTEKETGYVLVEQGEAIDSIKVNVELPKDTGNAAQGATVTVKFVIEAIQGNGIETTSETDTETETEVDTETETETE